MIWLLLIPHLLLAVALPQPSDVVLYYETNNQADQNKYNYLYTVAGDAAIYPCAVNRCSMETVRSQPLVTITVYKLPEGYPRVANITDQKLLAEYLAAAERSYTIPDVPTQPVAAADAVTGRTFQEIQLYADGSFERSVVTQEKNAQNAAAASTSGWRRWWWVGVGGLIIIGIGAVIIWLRKKKI